MRTAASCHGKPLDRSCVTTNVIAKCGHFQTNKFLYSVHVTWATAMTNRNRSVSWNLASVLAACAFGGAIPVLWASGRLREFEADNSKLKKLLAEAHPYSDALKGVFGIKRWQHENRPYRLKPHRERLVFAVMKVLG
jgi:hypothetical protein